MHCGQLSGSSWATWGYQAESSSVSPCPSCQKGRPLIRWSASWSCWNLLPCISPHHPLILIYLHRTGIELLLSIITGPSVTLIICLTWPNTSSREHSVLYYPVKACASAGRQSFFFSGLHISPSLTAHYYLACVFYESFFVFSEFQPHLYHSVWPLPFSFSCIHGSLREGRWKRQEGRRGRGKERRQEGGEGEGGGKRRKEVGRRNVWFTRCTNWWSSTHRQSREGSNSNLTYLFPCLPVLFVFLPQMHPSTAS